MTTRIGAWIATFVGTVAVAVLSSCGGDGGNGDTPPPPPPTQTVFTSGPISGFGSVYVNGVRYETASTDIEIDGAKASLSDLRVGQVIDLKGHVQGGSSSADLIRYSHNLEGPITSVDVEGLKFVAMGQTVLVDSDTLFGEGIDPATIEGLQVDDVVEVSGLIDGEGRIEATRVDPWAGSGPYDVFGTASEVNAAGKTFLTVDYSEANIEDFPSGSPEDGDLVLVTGFEFGEGGEFLATRVELRYDQQMLPDAGDKVHIAGLITNFVSPTDFDVAGAPVTTTSSTVYENGTVADLALDVRVCVEGTLNAEGVLVAERVRFALEQEIRIVSTVDAISPYGLEILGLTVALTPDTRFEDGRGAGLTLIDMTDINPGDWVEVRAYEYPAGSGEVVATRVTLLNEQDEQRMRGPFRNPAAPAFEILTVDVMTTDGTRFVVEDPAAGGGSGGEIITAAEFFATAVGELVEARGAWNGTVLTATHAIIKTCDD
jgi:hypothetical protein